MNATCRAFGFLFLAISAGIAVVVLFSLRRSEALPVLVSNPKFAIETTITFGTNHVYYYGDAVQRVFDPVITRVSDTNAYRLRHQTTQASTLIWIRLKHSDFSATPALIATPSGPVRKPVGRIPEFRAVLKDPTGGETVLERSEVVQQFKQAVIIGGYLLPKPLHTYRGGTLRLESGDREEIATFRIP